MILFDFYILHFELFSRQHLCNNLSFRVYLSLSIGGQSRGLLPARIGESRVYTGMASPRSGFSDAWSECSSHWMLSCTTDIWWPNAFFFFWDTKLPVRSVSAVCSHMGCYGTWLRELPITNCAAERLFSAVSAAMGCQICRLTHQISRS